MPEHQSDISILIIYTGGTIGMMEDSTSGSLKPFPFDQILDEVPELKRFGYKIDTIAFDPPIDSSNIRPDLWVKIAENIETNYYKYDGFIVLHGTDTMSYTASALSFMMQNLQKPIIFTGSQLPLGSLRTDGRDNIITAVEIASSKNNLNSVVKEVCIYFENKLYRANRTTKLSSENFRAFWSGNYPALAETGVYIKFNYQSLLHANEYENLKVHKKFDRNVAIIKLFPGITEEVLYNTLEIKSLKALIIETYGAGNAPSEAWFINFIKAAIEKDLIVLNVSQCLEGRVEPGKYQTNLELEKIGVVGGKDITTEAAVTKLMLLLGSGLKKVEILEKLNQSISGELTPI